MVTDLKQVAQRIALGGMPVKNIWLEVSFYPVNVSDWCRYGIFRNWSVGSVQEDDVPAAGVIAGIGQVNGAWSLPTMQRLKVERIIP